jgi:hypothetical protein
MLLAPSSAGDATLHEEERIARSRGMTALRFHIEIIPLYVDREFESDEPIVLCCERRGIVAATAAMNQSAHCKRTILEESLVLDLLLFRKDGYDVIDTDGNETVTKASPLPGFDPVMARLTFRVRTADGEVCDVAAINLAKFIVGARGVVEDKVQLELGSILTFRAISTLQNSGSLPAGPWCTERGKTSHTATKEIRSENLTLTPCVAPEKEECCKHSRTPSMASGATETSPLKQDTNISDTDDSSSKNLKYQTPADGTVDDAVASWRTTNGSTPISSGVKHEPGTSLLSFGKESAGGTSQNELELSKCNSSKDDDNAEHNRILLSEHPFTPLVSRREPGEMYSCVTDENPWYESPIITTIHSPLPISVWSVQGPEEIDPDDEDDMMDLGNGSMVPKRNIAGLQAAASCSSRKCGPPAVPGTMSPLQKTYVLPTKTRQALYIALGKPVNLSRCSALVASRQVDQKTITIDEPELSDCDEEGSGSEQSDDDSSSNGSYAFDSNISLADVPQSSTPDSENTSLFDRIYNLEAESVGVEQVLTKSKLLLEDLRNERDYLKQLLQEKEVGTTQQVNSTMAAVDDKRVESLQKKNVEQAFLIESLRQELSTCTYAKLAAEAELSKLRQEMRSENSIRMENERLLNVILSLKRELDREPGIPDVLNELKRAKTELALERAKSETLRSEIARLQSPKSSSKQKRGFFGKSSNSESKSKLRGDSESPTSVMDET